MPRNVRNFWITAHIDGRKERLVGGPARADGGFELAILARHKGAIVDPVVIDGSEVGDGKLRLRILVDGSTAVNKTVTTPPDGSSLIELVFER